MVVPRADEAADTAAGTDLGRVAGTTYRRLKPGVSTKAEVRALLGAPWRTVQYNDMDALEDEIWEYRGRDSSGAYRIHIEFGPDGIVRIVGKIPDRIPGGAGVAAEPGPSGNNSAQ
jgi:hypothetical protein